MFTRDACPCAFQGVRGTGLNLVLSRQCSGFGLIWVNRHWPEFGIVTMLWIRGTGLIGDKRHWPEFGIVTILWIRGTGLSFVLSQYCG